MTPSHDKFGACAVFNSNLKREYMYMQLKYNTNYWNHNTVSQLIINQQSKISRGIGWTHYILVPSSKITDKITTFQSVHGKLKLHVHEIHMPGQISKTGFSRASRLPLWGHSEDSSFLQPLYVKESIKSTHIVSSIPTCQPLKHSSTSSKWKLGIS
jgi:hypothetical protein